MLLVTATEILQIQAMDYKLVVFTAIDQSCHWHLC